MNFQKILLLLTLSSILLFILSNSKQITEKFYQEEQVEKDEQKIPIVKPTNTPQLNLFKEVPDYLARIVKERNNTFLIYDDNTRQDASLDGLDDEIEKLSNLITSLSVPIAENSVEKSSLKTNLNIEYDPNHFYPN